MAKRPDDVGANPGNHARPGGQSDDYGHRNPAVQRPAVGVQEELPDRRRPKTYRYDCSLAPELAWDENAERELAEWLRGLIKGATTEITEAAAKGKAEAAYFAEVRAWARTGERFGSVDECVTRRKSFTRRFNWAGKAERQAIRVPTIWTPTSTWDPGATAFSWGTPARP